MKHQIQCQLSGLQPRQPPTTRSARTAWPWRRRAYATRQLRSAAPGDQRYAVRVLLRPGWTRLPRRHRAPITETTMTAGGIANRRKAPVTGGARQHIADKWSGSSHVRHRRAIHHHQARRRLPRAGGRILAAQLLARVASDGVHTKTGETLGQVPEPCATTGAAVQPEQPEQPERWRRPADGRPGPPPSSPPRRAAPKRRRPGSSLRRTAWHDHSPVGGGQRGLLGQAVPPVDRAPPMDGE